jgi:hypothetical protein
MTQSLEMLDEIVDDFEFPSDELLADELFESESEAEMDELFEQEAEFDELLMDEAPNRRPRRRPPPAALAAAIERQRSRAQGFERAVRGLAPYVRRDGNRARIAIPPAAIPQVAKRLGIQPRGVEILVRAASVAKPATSTLVAHEIDFEAGSACLGEFGLSPHIWGIRLRLNSCQTNDLIALAKTGAEATKVCAVVVKQPKAAAVCKVVAALLSLGVTLVEAIHKRGGNRGIVVRWVPVLGVPPVIWHQ